MTAVTAMAMMIEVSSLVVTASAEQMPSTCRAIGLSFSSGLSRTSLTFGSAMAIEGSGVRDQGTSPEVFQCWARCLPKAVGPSQYLTMLSTPFEVIVAPDKPSTPYASSAAALPFTTPRSTSPLSS